LDNPIRHVNPGGGTLVSPPRCAVAVGAHSFRSPPSVRTFRQKNFAVLRKILPLLCLACLLVPSFTACNPKAKQTVAVLETEFGKIVFEFFPDIAPKHTARIQELIRTGAYDGTAFHRVEPGSLIQGGDLASKSAPEEKWGFGLPDLPKIPAEFSALHHVRGTVSAARVGNDNDSATTQFFICCSKHPEWDNRYSVFGQVIAGMNVVDIISNAPVKTGTTRPQRKIAILSATLEPRSNYPPSPNPK
jgi:peptidyl-prolyl cis-trans isomerase B (cyclophilin B)